MGDFTMKFKLKAISAATVGAIGVATGATLLANQVMAQTPTPAPAPAAQKIEKIEVTGSNIKRIDAEGTAPIQIITSEEIRRSGRQTVTELLRELPNNAAGGLTELTGSGSFSTGASSISLRGLGSSATLVLLNGRRIAPYGLSDPNFGQAGVVNLNAIPLDVIERIEILKDGASAIYGSEAIAGVVNIILRKDYTGAQVGVAGSANKGGDYQNGTVTGGFGFGDLAKDRYNVFVNFEGYQQESVMFRDVESFLNRQEFRNVYLTGVANSAFSPFITYISGPAGTTAPAAGASCPASQVISSATFLGAAGTQCLYDQWNFVEIVPKTKRNSVFARGTVDISGNTSLFAEASYVDNNIYFRGAPQTVGQGTGATFNPSTGRLNPAPTTLATGHPNNPYSRPTTARIRMDLVGSQDNEVDNRTLRTVLGAKTTFGKYDFEAGFLYNRNEQDVTNYNTIRYSSLVQAFAGGYNFLTGTGAITANDLRLNAKDKAESSFSVLDAKLSGELFSMAGGQSGFAVGAEYRKEDRSVRPDPAKLVGEIFGRGVSTADGERNVSTVYGEIILPVLKNVELQIAGRYDKYSDYGSSKTPKFAASWAPVSNFKLRASYAAGFRAPSLTEITRSATSGFFNNIDDPRRCNRAANITVGCGLSLPGLIEAFPDVQPEKARSYNAGLVFEPTTDTSISVDYFAISRKNEITFLSLNEILLNEGSRDPRYANRITRDPANTSTQVANDPGAILFVSTAFANLGETRVRGLDFDGRAKFSLSSFGKMTLGFNATYYIDQRGSGVPGAPLVSYSGFRNAPEWRAQLRANWETGNWTTTGALNYTASFKSFGNPENATGNALAAIRDCGNPNGTYLGYCTVSRYATFDLGTEYIGFNKLRLSLLVRNLTNERPALDPLARPFNLNWYQPQGINFVASARYMFR
jgi:iron complex outermembrane recepter protein